jgi:GAF domain-containing protein
MRSWRTRRGSSRRNPIPCRPWTGRWPSRWSWFPTPIRPPSRSCIARAGSRRPRLRLSPADADELQFELDEGPCLDAIWTQDVVTATDLAHDPRWPRWAPRVSSEFRFASMLCVRLFTTRNTVGGLNLYSTKTDAFDLDDLDIATYLAAHVAVAVADSQIEDQLRLARSTGPSSVRPRES